MQSHSLKVLVVSVGFQPSQFATGQPTCIQTYHRATHNSSFNLEQKWSQSNKGAVNGRLLSTKKAHIWTFPQLPPSVILLPPFFVC